jgi:outer membrane protein TolC
MANMSFLSKRLFTLAFSMYLFSYADAQTGVAGDTVHAFTLDQCIDYALQHQPYLNQALIGVDIARTTNAINQAGWLPQAGVSGNLQHYLSLPTTFVKNNGVTIQQRGGVVNTFTPVLAVTQTIFNPALVYAAKSAPLYVEQAEQITDSTKIFIVATVSKTFYNLLLTLEQINVLKEDTTRLAKNVHDTYHQYVAGTIDQTDYNEAQISLNNSKAQLKQAELNVYPQYTLLKQQLGMPAEQSFNVMYDTTQMQQDIDFDTTQSLDYSKRVEFRQLQTVRKLQDQTLRYYKLAWLPTVGGFFDYALAFQNNSFGKLFSNNYPYSFVGLSLNWQLFTGFSRTNSLRRAKLQSQQLDWSEVSLKSRIATEYQQALADYRSNRNNLQVMRDNVELARTTYDIVSLQYQQGVVAYLNVITAESNLINSEIGYQNALFQLLSSRVDLEKSLGVITIKRQVSK